jgi:serine/threonine-protein kinase
MPWDEGDDAPTHVALRRAGTDEVIAGTPWDDTEIHADTRVDDRVRLVEPQSSSYRAPSVPLPTAPQTAPPPAAGWGAHAVSAEPVLPAPPPAADSAGGADVSDVWRSALRRKTTTVMFGFLALCAGGVPLVALLSLRPEPAGAAYAGIGGIALITTLLLRRARRDTVEQLDWPWAVVAVFCVGPAYFFGVNGGFAAVMVIGLFSNGGFTAAQRNTFAFTIPLAVVASQGGLAALILTGVVPDHGLVPLRRAGATVWEPAFAHVLVQCIYLSAHAAGFLVDRKHGQLLAAAIRASREAAEQRVMLAAARMQLRRALAGDDVGVFSGHRVGDFELGAFLGRGGMGEVYEATHVVTGSPAAVKLIRTDRFGDEMTVQRFVREAALLARIDSPHVARVFAAGGDDGEIPYIAMERLDGRTLASLLRDRDALRPDELRAMVGDVGAALQALHGAGIVHRDLKPQNVMLVGGGGPRWKLLDLGVAKLLGAGSGNTSQHIVLGTPSYMSPEQAIGRDIDPRSDLYSFGLLIYRALAGRPAFAVHDPAEAIRAARRDGPPNPRDYVDIPRDLELVLRIALAADPAERFQSAAEMCAAFDAAFDRMLDPELRRRGRALLVRSPWARRG